VFKHAAIFPDHEEAVGELARSLGFDQVSLSSRVMQMVRMVPRGFTATADAYLTPHIMRYVSVLSLAFSVPPAVCTRGEGACARFCSGVREA
jgi:5-oxoprolinase (ATP-hydrolysing)